uniref:Uncharacterized protein n=1 Tax=Cucumis melo TaxID=3656 RepID=A0A9I9DUX2_CUCME
MGRGSRLKQKGRSSRLKRKGAAYGLAERRLGRRGHDSRPKRERKRLKLWRGSRLGGMAIGSQLGMKDAARRWKEIGSRLADAMALTESAACERRRLLAQTRRKSFAQRLGFLGRSAGRG